jgi:phenylpropionate dioxygenase-like ring-hydroxylating dioxygenase large terminal subunit
MTTAPSEQRTEPKLPTGCTFTESDWRILADYWHPVAFSHDVGSTPIRARLLDVDLIVYRTSQGVMVARNICLHRGSELTQGTLEGDELVCAYHGWRYGPDGRCVRIPAQPPSRRIAPSATGWCGPACPVSRAPACRTSPRRRTPATAG